MHGYSRLARWGFNGSGHDGSMLRANDLSSAAAVGGRLRRNVRCTMPLYKKLATIIFNGCSGYLLSVVAEINIYILHPQVNKIFGRFTLAGGVI